MRSKIICVTLLGSLGALVSILLLGLHINATWAYASLVWPFGEWLMVTQGHETEADFGLIVFLSVFANAVLYGVIGLIVFTFVDMLGRRRSRGR